jgi:hypothetical protein
MAKCIITIEDVGELHQVDATIEFYPEIKAEIKMTAAQALSLAMYNHGVDLANPDRLEKQP